MGRIVRLSEGRFGRLVLEELAAEEGIVTPDGPAIVLQSRFEDVVFLNPGESYVTRGATKALIVYAAREWLRAKGASAMRGPGEYSNATHERQAVLVEGFDTPPTVELTYNPPYYAEYLDRWGLAKVKDYEAHIIDLAETPMDRLAQIAKAVRQRGRLETRSIDMSRFNEDVRLVVRLFNEAWASNWGFLPLTVDEADTLAASLKPIVDPGLIRFAYADGEPVAVLGALPDPNWALRPRWQWYGDSDLVRIARLLVQKKRIPRIRLMFFGITPSFRQMGVDAVLFEESARHAMAKGYKTCEASMLLEDNLMVIRAAEMMGGHRYKVWRIFEREI
jgi:GNAT superfamily N-acetyltransferase